MSFLRLEGADEVGAVDLSGLQHTGFAPGCSLPSIMEHIRMAVSAISSISIMVRNRSTSSGSFLG